MPPTVRSPSSALLSVSTHIGRTESKQSPKASGEGAGPLRGDLSVFGAPTQSLNRATSLPCWLERGLGIHWLTVLHGEGDPAPYEDWAREGREKSTPESQASELRNKRH